MENRLHHHMNMHTPGNGAITVLLCAAAFGLATVSARADDAGSQRDQRDWLSQLNLAPRADDSLLALQPLPSSVYPLEIAVDRADWGEQDPVTPEPVAVPLPAAVFGGSGTLVASFFVALLRKRGSAVT